MVRIVLPGHGVNSILRILSDKSCNLKSIRGKLTPKKSINEKDVENHIDKKEKFAEEHPDGPTVMSVEGAVEENGKSLRLLPPLPRVQEGGWLMQPGDDGGNLQKNSNLGKVTFPPSASLKRAWGV